MERAARRTLVHITPTATMGICASLLMDRKSWTTGKVRTYVCMHLGLPFSLVVYLVVDCVVCHNLGDFLAIHTYTHETTCDVRM